MAERTARQPQLKVPVISKMAIQDIHLMELTIFMFYQALILSHILHTQQIEMIIENRYTPCKFPLGQNYTLVQSQCHGALGCTRTMLNLKMSLEWQKEKEAKRCLIMVGLYNYIFRTKHVWSNLLVCVTEHFTNTTSNKLSKPIECQTFLQCIHLYMEEAMKAY